MKVSAEVWVEAEEEAAEEEAAEEAAAVAKGDGFPFDVFLLPFFWF